MRQLLILFIFSSSLFCCGQAIVWEKDYKKALEASSQTKKPLLLFFTGSDCSGWGMMLKNEILLASDFTEKTKDHFIFVEIDFPEHKPLETSLAEQNLALKEKWQVDQLPRLIMIDSSQREISRFGATPLSPKEFGEELIAILQRDRALTQSMKNLSCCAVKQLEDLYRTARELKREQEATLLVEEGVERGAIFFLLEKYRELVDLGKVSDKKAQDIRKRLLALDPNNEKKVLFSLALIDFQKLSSERPANPLAVIRPLEDYLKQYGSQDKENQWRLEMMVAQFYLDCEDWNVALAHAEKALASAPESRQEEIARSVSYIREEASSLVCK